MERGPRVLARKVPFSREVEICGYELEMKSMKEQPWYYEERAQSLALMYLSRRKDLAIKRQQDDYGLDFLVTILKGESYTGRIFGIEATSALDLTKISRFTKYQAALYNDIPFPICLFFFSMSDDKAYYRWIKEPVIDAENWPYLEMSQSQTLTALTNQELARIIAEVDIWYDKRNTAAHNRQS